MRELIRLFLVFAKVGVMTIGGGYAMLPILMRELVEKRGWLDEVEFADMTAIGQCTPGIIAVNMATYVGYKRVKTLGGIITTLGVITPSVLIVSVIAAVLRGYTELPVVRHAFAGIRISVCALIVKTVVSLWKTSVKSKYAIMLVLVVFAASVLLDVSPTFLVIGSALVSILTGLYKSRAKKGGAK
ncbi:MAG: chromate transporter [Oscillospiraceae bacterium]|jgi:chromate transporter|nr:chromate transporter [Oscillospiraceae bacterium]